MKKLIIVIMLIAMFAILPAEQHQQTSDVIIETFSWEEGYKNVYLHAGTYSFDFECIVTSTEPFNTGNLWTHEALMDGSIICCSHGSCSNPITNWYDGYQSNTFGISQSGTYSIIAGTFANVGVVINSNTATLIRHQLNNND